MAEESHRTAYCSSCRLMRRPHQPQAVRSSTVEAPGLGSSGTRADRPGEPRALDRRAAPGLPGHVPDRFTVISTISTGPREVWAGYSDPHHMYHPEYALGPARPTTRPRPLDLSKDHRARKKQRDEGDAVHRLPRQRRREVAPPPTLAREVGPLHRTRHLMGPVGPALPGSAAVAAGASVLPSPGR
jgi:hypothetical protein